MNKLNVNMEIGQIPPQAIDFEEAVLGGIMLESDCFIEICDILTPDSFYKDSHQKIYNAIRSVYKDNNPIDLLSISEKLRLNKQLDDIGGYVYLSNLTAKIGSASHIEFHSRVIQQKYIQRELIRVSSEIQKAAYGEIEDVEELLNFAESQIFNITQGNLKKEPKHIGEIGKEQLRLLEEIGKSDKEFVGIPTGLPSLDRVLMGLQNKKLIILAARPAMGKTTMVISIARSIALEAQKNVAIFSLEMGADEIWSKFESDLTAITYAKITSGKLDDDGWMLIENGQHMLEKSNIYIDDTAGIGLFELRAKSRRLKLKHSIDIIFIDYLQLMSGDSVSGNREQELSVISRGLKKLSKDLDLPIVALSQLNRAVENRPDKKPQLSDLRESGAIEQDADIVAFIHRPEYYGFTTYDDNESTINKVDILIRKHRGGETADVNLDRMPNFSKIYEKSNDSFIQDVKPIEDNTDITPNMEF